MPAATILFVDDHPVFTDGFVSMANTLRPEWTIDRAGSAAQAREALGVRRPDLVIIDIFLPDLDGISLSKSLAGMAGSPPVLLISGREDVALQMRVRASGARGFVSKTVGPDELARAIDALLLGEFWFADFDAPANLPSLSPRQVQILALLAEGHSNKEIRHRLGIAERTVRAHLTDLFQQLGAQSRMQALVRARAVGLLE